MITEGAQPAAPEQLRTRVVVRHALSTLALQLAAFVTVAVTAGVLIWVLIPRK